jgi:hypothetical protein
MYFFNIFTRALLMAANLQICGNGLNRMLELGGHRSPTLAVDWAIANHCATCVTASSGDGRIKVSTLLMP